MGRRTLPSDSPKAHRQWGALGGLCPGLMLGALSWRRDSEREKPRSGLGTVSGRGLWWYGATEVIFRKMHLLGGSERSGLEVGKP